MQEKLKEKKIGLIEFENFDRKVDTKMIISNKKILENSKYAKLKNERQWPFDYEINNIKFDNLNKNKLYFIKNEKNNTCLECKI